MDKIQYEAAKKAKSYLKKKRRKEIKRDFVIGVILLAATVCLIIFA